MMILRSLSYEQGPCTLENRDMCRPLAWQTSSHMFYDLSACLIAFMLPLFHLLDCH
jgi:hypothetical protein